MNNFTNVFNVTHYSQSDIILSLDISKSYFFDPTIPLYNITDKGEEIFTQNFIDLSNTFEALLTVSYNTSCFLKGNYVTQLYNWLNNDISSIVTEANINNNTFLGTLTNGFSQMGSQLRAIGASDLPIASKALQGFSAIALGAVGIILQFVNYLTSAYKTMRDFEQANANLSTILGVTRDEMKALSDSALSLGRSTEYTASQVTHLQTELAKLGFGQGSIIAMQKPVSSSARAKS